MLFPNFKERIKNLQSKMSVAGLKAILITTRGALVYFTGTFFLWRTALVLGVNSNPILVTLNYDVERLKTQTWINNIITWEFGLNQDFSKKIALSLKRIGVEEGFVGVELDIADILGVISGQELLNLNEALPRIKIKNAIEDIWELMLIKDEYEIEQLRRAAEVADVGMQTAFNVLRPGISERKVLSLSEKAMTDAGDIFTWSAFGNECGSGYRQRYKNGFTASLFPTDKIIQYRDLVTIDLHPMINYYESDFALNALVGPLNNPIKKLADSYEEIVQILIEALKPGKTVNDVAKTLDNTVNKMGLAEFCIPVYGHGLGTDARIPPIIKKGNERVLEPNMIIVALLQITDPEVGGFRLEVPVRLLEGGNEIFCKTPLCLHICDTK